jgi:hypothetical protein
MTCMHVIVYILIVERLRPVLYVEFRSRRMQFKHAIDNEA